MAEFKGRVLLVEISFVHRRVLGIVITIDAEVESSCAGLTVIIIVLVLLTIGVSKVMAHDSKEPGLRVMEAEPAGTDTSVPIFPENWPVVTAGTGLTIFPKTRTTS